MATLEYRFTRSTPVLRDLARTRRQSPPSPLLRTSSGHAEKVKTLEFIDSSLSLLGDLQRDQDDLQKAQDNHIRREFEQQREFIRDKFAQEQYENGRRDSTVDQRFTKIKEQLESFRKEIDKRFEEVGQRFEEVGQRFEEVGQRFEEVGQRFEEVGQRFDEAESKFDDFSNQVDQRFDQVDQQFSEINARMFNALSYRDRHPIQPLAVLRGGRLREPDKDCFPGTVKEFLAMRSAPNSEFYTSSRSGDSVLTIDQLGRYFLCSNFILSRNTNCGIETVKRPNLTRKILR
jgi:archaellum component FlaC